MRGYGDSANLSWLFIFHSVMQVPHGGQLTVNHLFQLVHRVVGGRGELDGDG